MRNLVALSFLVVTLLVGCGIQETPPAMVPQYSIWNDDELILQARTSLEELRNQFASRPNFDPRPYPTHLQELLTPTRTDANKRIVRVLLIESHAYVFTANLEEVRAALASAREVSRWEHPVAIASFLGRSLGGGLPVPPPNVDPGPWGQQTTVAYQARLAATEAALTRMETYLRVSANPRVYIRGFRMPARPDPSLTVLEAIRHRVDGLNLDFVGRVPRFIARGNEATILARQEAIRQRVTAMIAAITLVPTGAITTFGNIVPAP